MLADRKRRLLRIAACSLLAFSGLTCTDTPTGPSHGRGGAALLSFAPSFSVASAAVYDGLGAFGLTVDNIHIHIDHPPAPPFDTVVTVPPGSDSLLLNLPVQLAAPTEQLNVLIELRDGSQVLFSGTQTVTATVGVTPSGPAPSIPIVYVGPGAGATQLAIAPRDTAVAPNGVLPFRFVAKDANNATLTGVTVAWTTSGAALGAIDANGVFTAGPTQGVTRIVASTLNGLRDSTTLTVTAPAAKLVVVSGGGQTGVVGTSLPQPFIVQAQTATGTPVPGIPISFSAPGSGSVNPASAVTDVSGDAQTTMTLGHSAGAQSFGATSGTLTAVSAAASATAAAGATVTKVSGDAQADSIGSVLPNPLVVRVTDVFSNPVANATVDWVRIAGDGALAAASSQTTADGLANMTYTLSKTIRTDSITATLHGVPTASVQFTATSLAKQPSSITRVSGDGQTAVVSSVLANPLVVKVADDSGRPVVGAQVTWTIVGGGGTVSPATSATDSTGTAQAVLTLGSAAGTNTVSASVSSTLSISFTATATAAVPATITRVAGDSQVVAAGSALQVKPSVRVADAHGNPIVGATVTFAVAAGGGAVTGASQTTNASGVATVGGWTVGPSGSQTLTATSGSLSVAFTALISGPPGAIGSTQVTSHLDTLTALGDTYTLIAQARDTLGALAAGTFTWVSRTPATATVNSAGVVTGVANGSTWVVATEAGGTRDSAQIVVQQRVATVLVTPGTRNVYLTRTYTLTAQAVDGHGNALTGTPTFTWTTNAPAVATVSSAGLVTGVGLGSAQISATTGTITGVSQISILTPITRIVVGRDSVSLPVSDTTSLKSLGVTRTYRAVAHDTLDVPMTGVTFAWASTNGSVAVLDSLTATTARATSAANGITAITATAQGISGSASLSVAQALAKIDLTPKADTIAVNGSGAIVARGLDANNRFISGGSFTYTSLQPSVATVNATSGVVTGVTNGTAFVRATSGSITSDTAIVTVGGSVPAAISFGRDTLSVGRGSNVSVPIYLSKPNATAVTVHLTVGDTTAYWTNANVVIPAGQTAVNATLNGHNAGTTIVTATDSSGTGFSPDTAVLAVQATMRLTTSSYAINTTDQTSTQVLLSDPSPVGGTYVTFNFGTTGVATVSPNPAFIPAGQLAADIQITAADSGTTTITPTAIGVNGTASSFRAYGAWLRFSATADRLGTGQYDPNSSPYNYVYVPTYNNLAVPVTLTSSDSTIVSVPHSVTIPGGSYYVYFTTTALAPGTATITASAPGWTTTNSTVVTVTTPHVGISSCCGTSLVTTSPIQTVYVYAEDSLKSSHYQTNSLVVRLRSSDTTVMKVLDSVVTIPPGAQYITTPRVMPGSTGGSAYVVASASGHTSDSVSYTVAGPQLYLNLYASRVGLGQQDGNAYVQIPNSIAMALVVNIASGDSTIVGVPTTVTIPAGNTYTYFTVRGMGLGSTNVTASVAGYQSASGTYTVTTPRLQLTGGTTLNNYGPRQTLSVYAEDSLGTTHNLMAPITVSFASRDTTVITVDSTTAVIPAGTYVSSARGATPAGIGTTRVVASAPGYRADSASFTVQIPKLYTDITTYYIGEGQHQLPTRFYVQTPNTRTSPLSVTVTQRYPNVDSLTATSFTVPTSNSLAYFGLYGLTHGTDTLIFSAPGYLSDTNFVIVSTPRLSASSITSTLTTTSPRQLHYVYALDSLGQNYQYVTDTLAIKVVSSDTTVLRPAHTYIHVPANQYYGPPDTVNVVGPGTATITYSDSIGGTYQPATTNIVTVTGPSLGLYYSSIVLGMRQTTGSSGESVTIPNALASSLVVHLVSTGTRVATVPDSVIIAAGYTSANFGITAHDTVGTIQIQATATGYGATSITTQVTQPKFQISTGGSLYTTSAKQSITVYAEDANGNTHNTTDTVLVMLASSSPSVASLDSTFVTILPGAYYSNSATWSPGVVGTAQLSASDTTAALYKYNSGTTNVTVSNPNLTFGWSSTPLGIGQYFDSDVYATNNQTAPLTVTLSHTGTAYTTTVPASPLTIPNGNSYTALRVIGAAAGTDTLIASASSPFHNPATAYTVVGQGRLDPLTGWPATLAVGDSVAITLYARDPSQNTRYVLSPTTFTLAPNANIAFHSAGSVVTSVTIPAGAQYVMFYVKALTAGTASATISAANYQSYTNTFTVTP